MEEGIFLVFELGSVVVVHVHLVLIGTNDKAQGNAAEGDFLPHRSASCAEEQEQEEQQQWGSSNMRVSAMWGKQPLQYHRAHFLASPSCPPLAKRSEP